LSTEHNPSGGATPGYETRDANPESLVKFAITLAVTVLVTMAGMWWLMGYYGRVQDLGAGATPFGKLHEKQLPPLPRIQVEPVHELDEVRDQQRHAAESYGWVDREHGIVHIPVTQAMDLILARGGLPARQSANLSGAPVSAAPAKAKPAHGKSAP